MNPKTQALYWEECRTGGAFAAYSAAAGLIAAVGLFVITGNRPPNLVPLLLYSVPIFFLTYVIPNKGLATPHQHALLPNRIMLLPIEMKYAISRILFIRLALVFSANLLLILSSNMLFINGVPWILLLIIPSLFLVRQAWKWLYTFRLMLVAYTGVLLVAMLCVSLILGRIPIESLSNPLVTWPIATTISIGVGLWTYKVSAFAAKHIRCNRYPAFPFRLPGRQATFKRGAIAPLVFRSSRTANLWAFCRRKGLSLAIATFGIALLGAFLYALYDLTATTTPDPSEQFLGEPRLHLSLLRVWGPWYALLCASMLSGLLHGGNALETRRMCASTERFFPLSANAITTTRILGNGQSLLVTWFIVMLAAASPFLFSQDALGWRIYSEAWRAGEVSAREIARSELGLPLLMLLVAWVLLAIRTRLVLYTAGLAILPIAVEAVSQFQTYAFRSMVFEQYVRYLLQSELSLTFAVTVVIIVPFAALSWAAWRHLTPFRHITCCGLAWLSITLFVYPYRQWPVGGPEFVTIALAMAMASLTILPYPALLIDIHRSRHGSDSSLSQSERRAAFSWNLQPSVRYLLAALLSTVLLVTCWISWPSKPAYVNTLRENGKPAILSDVAKLVAKASHGVRASGDLIGLLQQTERSESEAFKRLSGGEYMDNSQYMDFSRGAGMLHDSSSLRSGEISRTTWNALTARSKFFSLQTASTKQLAFEAGKLSGPVSRLLDYELFEDTFMVLPMRNWVGNFQREFPLSTLEEYWTDANHSNEMGQLANALALEIWIASVEDNRVELFRVLKFTEILAKTLREEPTVVSQISYLYLYASIVQAIGFSMNRVEFTDDELQSLTRWSGDVLPAGAARKAIELAVAHEMSFQVDYELRAARTGNQLTGPAAYAESWSGGYYKATRLRLYDHISRDSEATDVAPIWTDVASSVLPRFEMVAYAAYRAGQYYEALKDIQFKSIALKTVCALERYRLMHGTLPDQLEQVAPDYIDRIGDDPHKPGQAISYRMRDDGEFVLYSWGPDGEDNWENENGSDDLTFSVAPTSQRNAPHVADAPSQLKIGT